MRKLKESYKNLIDGRNPNLILVLFPIIGLLVLILIPFLLTRRNSIFPDYSDTGQIGDTFGGIAGPIIALLAALLTFFAFWTQLRANINQTKQFNKQDEDTKVDRFENKFFEMIKLHRENLSEISIANNLVTGRKTFISMFHEFKFCYHVINILNQIEIDENSAYVALPDREMVNISYLVFYMGVGQNSDNLTRNLVESRYSDILDKYLTTLTEYRNNWKKHQPQVYLNKNAKTLYVLTNKYKPFGGHVSRLGHYYRHLYQVVKFVSEQSEKIIPNKYEYIKILRAQLSDYEQLLLYYNSISVLGEPWNIHGFIKEFKLIKNIPLPLADFGITPREKYGSYDESGRKLYEWDEITAFFPGE